MFKLKFNLAKLKKSNPWTMKDLEAVLRDLKRDKSRDFEGYINEIFMKDIIGTTCCVSAKLE